MQNAGTTMMDCYKAECTHIKKQKKKTPGFSLTNAE